MLPHYSLSHSVSCPPVGSPSSQRATQKELACWLADAQAQGQAPAAAEAAEAAEDSQSSRAKGLGKRGCQSLRQSCAEVSEPCLVVSVQLLLLCSTTHLTDKEYLELKRKQRDEPKAATEVPAAAAQPWK